MSEDAQTLAKRCADAMWAADRASQGIGLELVGVGPGRAEMMMTVQPAMTNGHGTCHGGFIFTLADSAFAFACNSYNQRTVAQHCSVTYIRPAQLGDRLRAIAIERSRSGRNGIYDVAVAIDGGKVIAEFRGHSRTVEGTLV